MLILQQHLTLVTTINTQGGKKKKKKPLTGLPGSCFCNASQAGSAPAQARLALTPGAAFKAAQGEGEQSKVTGS